MLDEETLDGGIQDDQGGASGQDESDAWEKNTEEQLFGKKDPEPDADGQKGEPENADLPLERIQKHPVVQDLQSRYDRQGNVNKFLTDQLKQSQEQIKLFRAKETDELLQQLGDTPNTRALLKRLETLDEREAQLNLLQGQLAPIQKVQTCNDIMKDYTIPEAYREDLMASKTPQEMELMGQSIKKVLEKLPKPPPGQKGKVNTPPGKGQPARQPAMSHVPDKGQGSVAPQSFEQAENDYIAGKISYQKYQEAADKAGVKLH